MKDSDRCIVPGVIVFAVLVILALSIFQPAEHAEPVQTVEVGQIWEEIVLDPFKVGEARRRHVLAVRDGFVQYEWNWTNCISGNGGWITNSTDLPTFKYGMALVKEGE